MKLLRPLSVALLAGTVSFAAVPLAHAAFRDDASSQSSFSAAQLTAPTALAVTKRCTLGALGIVLGASFDLTWTPSSTGWATGQRVTVTDSNGLTVATKDVGPAVTATSVGLPLISGGTYTVTVRATYSSWTSGATSKSSTGC